ncbi:MAG: glycogen synthase [Clostridiales bacterium]|nr:glycogen synthase [Clostridiales bacterium]
MKILFVTSEMYPFVRTKDMANFSYDLTRHLANQDVEVRVVMPKYKNADIKKLQYVCDFSVDMANRQETCIIKKTLIGRVEVYFVENYQYFGRDFMYAYEDDCERFAFFSNAVVKMIKHIDFRPCVIHLNDWSTAPVSMIINENKRDDAFYKKIALVYTIHDLTCQGICSKGFLRLMGVNDTAFSFDKAEYYNMLNYAKMGITYSDIVTTVSETYAQEIKERAYGNGLDGVLRSRGADVLGVLNGIDQREFNPRTDKVLHKNYDYISCRSKLANKYFLQDKLNLPRKDVPMIAFIAPLTEEKGVEILLESMDDILKNDVQLVIVGVGTAVYEYSIKFAMSKYKYQIFALIGEDDELIRQIFAASDIFLAPYRMNPCGKNELIALRYGVVPVATGVGSLRDVIVDVRKDEKGYGYIFERFSKSNMMEALASAIVDYEDKDKWYSMVVRALKKNFSWTKTTASYKGIYKLFAEDVRKPINFSDCRQMDNELHQDFRESINLI